MHQYLTTKELADLLRLKERKVYDLAASGEIPCTRATGKLLFPRDGVEAWLATHTDSGALGAAAARRVVFLGSHDPLLDWALRESRCGIATFFDGSTDGLNRFAEREGIAASLHIYDPASADWNVPAIKARLGMGSAVLIEWAWRQRGLITAPERAATVHGLKDLAGLRFVPRQPEAGTQVLFEHLLAEAEMEPGALVLAPAARSETDAALAVLSGEGDAAFGLEALAAQYRLPFVPVILERFDLLIDRRSFFEPPMQTFLAFCRGETFAAKAAGLAGYDVSGFGQVRLNGLAP